MFDTAQEETQEDFWLGVGGCLSLLVCVPSFVVLAFYANGDINFDKIPIWIFFPFVILIFLSIRINSKHLK